jgi:hypothetical protein
MDEVSYKLGQTDVQLKALTVTIIEILKHEEASDRALRRLYEVVDDLRGKVDSILQNSVEVSN